MSTQTKQRTIKESIEALISFDYEDDQGNVMEMECVEGMWEGHIEYEGMYFDFENLASADIIELFEKYF